VNYPRQGGVRFIKFASRSCRPHLLDNDPVAMVSLHRFLERVELLPILRDELDEVFARLKRYAPRMNLADGCLVALAARDADAVVLTTDTRDFSTYRVPFASPEGLFAEK